MKEPDINQKLFIFFKLSPVKVCLVQLFRLQILRINIEHRHEEWVLQITNLIFKFFKVYIIALRD